MGRDDMHQDGVIHSSIFLLQERFKQLQKEKEMREKRGLLRMFFEAQEKSKSFHTSSVARCNSNGDSPHHVVASSMQYRGALNFFFHPELTMPTANHPSPRPVIDRCLDDGDHNDRFRLSLVSISTMKNNMNVGGFGMKKTSLPFVDCNKKSDDDASEVDTSLHL
ncbi:hypothetical protein Droror1_Dr00002435 [Drosera rotundifolia]